LGRKNRRRLAILAEGEEAKTAEDNPYFSYGSVDSLTDLKRKMKPKL